MLQEAYGLKPEVHPETTEDLKELDALREELSKTKHELSMTKNELNNAQLKYTKVSRELDVVIAHRNMVVRHLTWLTGTCQVQPEVYKRADLRR